jgi:hypothetical protein
VNQERDEREDRHLRMLREHLIATCRDDIADYQQKRADAAARDREHEREMYEDWLSQSRARLAATEAGSGPPRRGLRWALDRRLQLLSRVDSEGAGLNS